MTKSALNLLRSTRLAWIAAANTVAILVWLFLASDFGVSEPASILHILLAAILGLGIFLELRGSRFARWANLLPLLLSFMYWFSTGIVSTYGRGEGGSGIFVLFLGAPALIIGAITAGFYFARRTRAA